MKLHEIDRTEGKKYKDSRGREWVIRKGFLVDLDGDDLTDTYNSYGLYGLNFTPVPQYTQLDIDLAKALKAEAYVYLKKVLWTLKAVGEGGQELCVPYFMFEPLKAGQTVPIDDIIGG